MSLLPSGYVMPKEISKYLKLSQGETKVRILGSAIVGWVGWREDADGKRKPVRVPEFNTVLSDDPSIDPESIKHFWVLPVYNYTDKAVQVWEITQRSIQKKIKAFNDNPDWGEATKYDLTITRDGEELSTRYEVVASPPSPMSKTITEAWSAASKDFDLNRLFSDSDPFERSDKEEPIEATGQQSTQTPTQQTTSPVVRLWEDDGKTLTKLGVGIQEKLKEGKSLDEVKTALANKVTITAELDEQLQVIYEMLVEQNADNINIEDIPF